MRRKSKEKLLKRRVGKGWRRLENVGPAESAEAAYFASRKQNRMSESAFLFLYSTRLSQGLGRIQPLRAFRRARLDSKLEIRFRDLQIRVRSVRFTPRGFEKKELRRNS